MAVNKETKFPDQQYTSSQTTMCHLWKATQSGRLLERRQCRKQSKTQEIIQHNTKTRQDNGSTKSERIKKLNMPRLRFGETVVARAYTIQDPHQHTQVTPAMNTKTTHQGPLTPITNTRQLNDPYP